MDFGYAYDAIKQEFIDLKPYVSLFLGIYNPLILIERSSLRNSPKEMNLGWYSIGISTLL